MKSNVNFIAVKTVEDLLRDMNGKLSLAEIESYCARNHVSLVIGDGKVTALRRE